MNHIITRYGLSRPEQQIFAQSAAPGLVIATNQTVTCWAFNQWSEPLWMLQPTQADTPIYALHTFYTGAGTKIAFVTGGGQLYLVNAQGLLHRQQMVTNRAIWHITSGLLGQRRVLFASCTDQTIHLLDLNGEPLGRFITPGPVLSLAVAPVQERVKLVGGVQGRSSLYLWDWQKMVDRRDATPEIVLRGGDMPAFAVLFDLRPQHGGIWHSCGDGNIYFYDLPAQDSPHILSAALTLRGNSPVYPLLLTTLGSVPYLMAGTESGDIVAWDVSQKTNLRQPDWVLARLRQRVKCLVTARVGEHDYLIAGGLGGRVHIWQMQARGAITPITVLETEAHEVRGIDVVMM